MKQRKLSVTLSLAILAWRLLPAFSPSFRLQAYELVDDVLSSCVDGSTASVAGYPSW
jgi:hypothetical protein